MDDRMAALRDAFMRLHDGVDIEWAQDGTPYVSDETPAIYWMVSDWGAFLAGYKRGVEDAAEALRPEASDMIPRVRSLLPAEGE